MVSVNWQCCRTNLSTKTFQAKATDLSCHFLRASCDGCYFHLLNSLAWTDLSKHSYGCVLMTPFFYSDITTIKSSAGIYISYPSGVLMYMDYIHTHFYKIYFKLQYKYRLIHGSFGPWVLCNLPPTI